MLTMKETLPTRAGAAKIKWSELVEGDEYDSPSIDSNGVIRLPFLAGAQFVPLLDETQFLFVAGTDPDTIDDSDYNPVFLGGTHQSGNEKHTFLIRLDGFPQLLAFAKGGPQALFAAIIPDVMMPFMPTRGAILLQGTLAAVKLADVWEGLKLPDGVTFDADDPEEAADRKLLGLDNTLDGRGFFDVQVVDGSCGGGEKLTAAIAEGVLKLYGRTTLNLEGPHLMMQLTGLASAQPKFRVVDAGSDRDEAVAESGAVKDTCGEPSACACTAVADAAQTVRQSAPPAHDSSVRGTSPAAHQTVGSEGIV